MGWDIVEHLLITLVAKDHLDPFLTLWILYPMDPMMVFPYPMDFMMVFPYPMDPMMVFPHPMVPMMVFPYPIAVSLTSGLLSCPLLLRFCPALLACALLTRQCVVVYIHPHQHVAA